MDFQQGQQSWMIFILYTFVVFACSGNIDMLIMLVVAENSGHFNLGIFDNKKNQMFENVIY